MSSRPRMKSLPPADWFLSLRYLRPKRTFVSVITLLSILGPVLGVALLVIVTSVMSGFDHDIRDKILGMQAHLQVFPPTSYLSDQKPVIQDPTPVLEALTRNQAFGSPLIEGPVLLQVRDKISAKYLKGILPDKERLVTSLGQKENLRGRFDIREGEALIGDEMAAELGLRLGDRFLVHSPSKLTRSVEWGKDGQVKVNKSDEVYLPEELTVVGIFSMGVYEYNSSILFVHLDQAANLFGMEWGSATSIQVRAPDPFKMAPLVSELRRLFPAYRFMTWEEANEVLFGALRVEKNLMFFLLFFIVIVASFGIAGTLITVVVQKTREIGIMKAVGMTNGMIARIFLYQGAIIGVVGSTVGTLLGAVVIQNRNTIAALLGKIMGVEVFPAKLYHLTKIPGFLVPSDMVLIVGMSMLICIAAAVIPALYAAALSPADALREDNG